MIIQADIYKKGDKVEAVILGIDKDNKKISLGIKQLQPRSMGKLEQEYPVGIIVEGEVSKITNFGAFVKLPIGIEGLVHISELSDHNVEKVEDVLKVGQNAQFRVINVNKEDRKLGLSLKQRRYYRETTARSEERRETRKQTCCRSKVEKATKLQLAPKAKNLFQLELEKYAARKKDDRR